MTCGVGSSQQTITFTLLCATAKGHNRRAKATTRKCFSMNVSLSPRYSTPWFGPTIGDRVSSVPTACHHLAFDDFDDRWPPFGYHDCDWPDWPEQLMAHWLPRRICAEYGKSAGSLLNGDFLMLDAQRKEIVQALEREGFQLRHDPRLVTRACGRWPGRDVSETPSLPSTKASQITIFVVTSVSSLPSRLRTAGASNQNSVGFGYRVFVCSNDAVFGRFYSGACQARLTVDSNRNKVNQ